MMSEKLEKLLKEHVEHAKALMRSSDLIKSEFVRIYISDGFYKNFKTWDDLLDDINQYETHSLGKVMFVNELKTLYENYKEENN